jgi:two-component system cell cycle sensor histidine kinase/response regulator CckA
VLPAPNGVDAVALADSVAAVDLLLTDLVMPGMGGKELARRLTGRWPGMAVAFMSGYPDGPTHLDDATHADEVAGPLLHKPFTVQGLLGHVRRALDGRETAVPA